MVTGDAPEMVCSTYNGTDRYAFESSKDNVTVYYSKDSKGFTTPEWCGYKCYPENGRLSALEARLLLRYISGIDTQKPFADTDRDNNGKTDIADVIAILN